MRERERERESFLHFAAMLHLSLSWFLLVNVLVITLMNL